jgi:TPR repeat protein
MKAAEQGVTLAQYNVGIAYASGTGVERNKQEAVKWFDKAASNGNRKAQEYA